MQSYISDTINLSKIIKVSLSLNNKLILYN